MPYIALLVCFNPLPAVKLGDTGRRSEQLERTEVSIRSQRLSWEIQHQDESDTSDSDVSIRSQRLSWEIPGVGSVGGIPECFNPLPAVKLGDTYHV